MEVADVERSENSMFHRNTRLPEDTVFYEIIPDFSVSEGFKKQDLFTLFQSLHLQILETVSPYVSDYYWQHEPFNLSISLNPAKYVCSNKIAHLHGKTKYGDNLEDEWFIVFLLYEITRKIPRVSVRVWDTDGEFLLIETAFKLPKWIHPQTSVNRVFIRRGELHIIPNDKFVSNPSLFDSLKCLVNGKSETRASDSVQTMSNSRISCYPERARMNTHRIRVRVPLAVARVLKHEPCLISLAVEGFYDRDVDSMKHAARMERFLGDVNREEEMVRISISMSRAMYAQLVQQTFRAPRVYPMPSRLEGSDYIEAELGMKIACGFEMMYQQRRIGGVEGKGRSWDAFLDSLNQSEYFRGLLPGSKEYKELMEKALTYFKGSSLFSRTRDILHGPVKRIDEILSLHFSVEDYRVTDLPPPDNDAWLYNGEDELNSAILARQKEMEAYESKYRKNHAFKDQKDSGDTLNKEKKDLDLGIVAKSMQQFVEKVSSFEGAEVPENRDSKAVELDVDRFVKEMEAVLGCSNPESNTSDDDDEVYSSSDMDFDASEDDSSLVDEDTFMHSYSDALSEELSSTTLKRSFIRANEPSSGSIGTCKDDGEEFNPIDIDVNLVRSLLDSFSSQQGLPGPVSNLLGLMGLNLPQDSNKEK